MGHDASRGAADEPCPMLVWDREDDRIAISWKFTSRGLIEMTRLGVESAIPLHSCERQKGSGWITVMCAGSHDACRLFISHVEG